MMVSSKEKGGCVIPDLSTRFKLKVVPGASRSEIAGWMGDMLKVRVCAPPEKGKANAAVEAMVARALNIPTGSVGIVSGTSSQHKVIEIRGLSKAEILEKLAAPDREGSGGHQQ